MNGYSCINCNHWYEYDDPEFVYYREFGERHWAVRKGLVQTGDPMDGRAGVPRTSLGWFAHCRDQERCAQFRRNNRLGQNHFQEELFPAVTIRDALPVLWRDEYDNPSYLRDEDTNG